MINDCHADHWFTVEPDDKFVSVAADSRRSCDLVQVCNPHI